LGNKLGNILGNKRAYIHLRNGRWHYWRRVPKEFSHVDTRVFAKQSLRTDSEEIAIKRAGVVNEATEQYWHDLLAHGGSDAKEKYQAAVSLARTLGLSYRHAEDIATGKLSEIMKRMDMVSKDDPNKISEAKTSAILGGTDKPELTLSHALSEFWELTEHETRTKTDRELRRWQTPRKKAVRNFITVIGDFLLQDINRSDALDFRSWWLERIQAQNLTANAANKDIQHLSGIFRTVNDDLRLGLVNPFEKLRLSEKNDGGNRVPFATEYVQNTLLDLEKLTNAGLSLEAQMLILAASDTGCGMSELTGLDPEYDEINLKNKIPHIHIKANSHRGLKVKHRDRKIPLVGAALYAFKQCADGFPTYRGKADSASSWINRAMRVAGLFNETGHSLYSLRHSFEDRLTAVETPDKIAAALMGHSFHRPRYGHGPSLEQKHEWLSKIEFKV